MSWITWTAIFFIVWWLVLFATLPFSLRTQDEEGEVTLGTVSSAPRGPHMLRAILRTTIVTAVLFALYWGLAQWLGLSLDSIPRIIPEFG